jgi:hypothetical protein
VDLVAAAVVVEVEVEVEKAAPSKEGRRWHWHVLKGMHREEFLGCAGRVHCENVEELLARLAQ